MKGAAKRNRKINRLTLKGSLVDPGIVDFIYGTVYFQANKAIIKYQYEDHQGLISLKRDASYIKIMDGENDLKIDLELLKLEIGEEYIEILYDSGELIEIHIDIDKEF